VTIARLLAIRMRRVTDSDCQEFGTGFEIISFYLADG